MIEMKRISWLVFLVLCSCGGAAGGKQGDVGMGGWGDGAGESVTDLAVADVAVDLSTEAVSDEALAPDAVAKPVLPSMIPGPGQDGYDEELAALARMYDRQFHLFNAVGHGLNSDVVVPLEAPADRELVEQFLRESDGWDFEAFAGKDVYSVITDWQKVAGLYGGVGIGADAFSYGVLRDGDYPQEEVDRARGFLLVSLDRLSVAVEVTGVPGVIARGFLRVDAPGYSQHVEVVDLFDEAGNPLPEVKNNGTWRADNSGLHPEYVWEDSCSRDMYIGWIVAFAGAWEVIRDDPAIPQELKSRVKGHALDLVRELMKVRESGYDLEIPDADGRITFHGYMNENNLDKMYLPGIRNGFYAIMALGSVAALQYVADDPEVESYLYDELIAKRELHVIASEPQVWVNQGVQSNFSNQNMAFTGAWLALRYVKNKDPHVLLTLQQCLKHALYDNGGKNQPVEMKVSLYDFVYAAGVSGANAWQAAQVSPDAGAMERGIETLKGFPEPPYWELEVVNCDEQELVAGECELIDGTMVSVEGEIGWNDSLVVDKPIPMSIRPASNYHWRSNPYRPNGGGDGARMAPGVDFRFAYWLARWVKVGG